jgi:transcriptional regulator with XRE-family HTH domain
LKARPRPKPERKTYPPLTALTAWRESNGHTLLQGAVVLGISKTEMYRWESGRRRVPGERVRAIEQLTKVPRHRLRPDLYDNDDEEAELRAVG